MNAQSNYINKCDIQQIEKSKNKPAQTQKLTQTQKQAQTQNTQTSKCTNKYAFIMQNVGTGLVTSFRNLLITKYDYPKENISVYAKDASLNKISSAKPTEANILKGLTELADKLQKGDFVVINFVCHMRKGFLVNNQLKYKKFNQALEKFPEGVTIFVFMTGCHSGASIPELKAANVVYTATHPTEIDYGAFQRFLVNALGGDEAAFAEADIDKNAKVSLGEAYDYANDEDKLKKWYKKLSPKVWPDKNYYPKPMKNENKIEYDTYLN